ncbi:MAG TPA: S41 family peptidase [Pseudobdellovibrionaceae bacterium]|nr:S41 family peptidase [Pseudobdellovibrionaceae bacterium]
MRLALSFLRSSLSLRVHVTQCLAAFGLGITLIGCGYPGRDLGPVEKAAEIEWLYGTFERNYAPAEWKADAQGPIPGVTLAQAKQDCLAQSATIQKADEFMAHMSRCVNRFADAHTRISGMGQVLPETIQVAHLGFQTQLVRFDANTDEAKPPRLEYGLRVVQILPTTTDTKFPVKEGDLITKVDGRDVQVYLREELMPYFNLGHEPASLVMSGQAFALRDSSTAPLPKAQDVSLEINREGTLVSVQLPWNHIDHVEFNKALEAAKPKATEASANNFRGYWVGFDGVDALLGLLQKYRSQIGERVRLLLTNGFRVYNLNATIAQARRLLAAQEDEKQEKGKELTSIESAIEEFTTPMEIFDVSVEPFKAKLLLAQDGSRLGYIKFDSFSGGDEALKAFRGLIARFNKSQVKGLIIDLLDNGGGDLILGMQMLNSLSIKSLQYPKMQLALNDNWLNSFKSDSLYAASDAQRTLAKRVLTQMRQDMAAGRRLSQPISVTELSPFDFDSLKTDCETSGKCLRKGAKISVLINETCASMCDIFAAVVRDNQLGRLFGSQTMGAGGNVVSHAFSPVTKMILGQTESLIVDVSGQYLENRGVKPDQSIDTLMDRDQNYVDTIRSAMKWSL